LLSGVSRTIPIEPTHTVQVDRDIVIAAIDDLLDLKLTEKQADLISLAIYDLIINNDKLIKIIQKSGECNVSKQ